MKNFYIIVVFFLTFSPTEILSKSKTKKKSTKTTTEAAETSTSQPAILAIEIVDPNENSTSSKNSKRTIEGSLGYGYNNFGASKPRYEVYKYSQHDIPAFKSSTNQLLQSSSNQQVNVQKSIQYILPTQKVAGSSNLLQPGTTLYSSLSEKGQVGGLSNSLPQASSFGHGNIPVPVVVLRLYPNQLQDSTIQANLPKTHPYAKSINSLNIQSLLLQYIKTLKSPGSLNQYSINQGSHGKNHGFTSQYLANQGSFGQNPVAIRQYSVNQGSIGRDPVSASQYSANQGSFGHNSYSLNQGYSAPLSTVVTPTATNYQMSSYYSQDSNRNAPNYQNNNGGAQNYMYYQQSFPQRSAQEYARPSQYQEERFPNYKGDVTVQEAPIKYQINNYQDGNQLKYQIAVTQKPQITKNVAPEPQPQSQSQHQPQPQPQFYYIQPNAQHGYSTESSEYYEPTQQLEYSKESIQTAIPPAQQYYAAYKDPQEQQYYQDAGQQYDSKIQKLLTYENYPTPQHTRVVFRTKTGNIRVPEEEEAPTKEIKTIKIHVPENIAKVEVQETERPYFGSGSSYSDTKLASKEQLTDPYQQSENYEKLAPQNNYYLPQPTVQQGYESNDESASGKAYNYKNINYDEMVKYFEKRSAMPKYFFQSPEDSEVKQESTTASTDDMMSVYEELAFPPTSSSTPVKKRVKSKKRTQI